MPKQDHFNPTKKQLKKHQKMIDANIETARKKYKEFYDDMAKLGFMIQPEIQPHDMIAGAWIGVIRLKTMTLEQWDRFHNPEKWEVIDKQLREEAAEATKKAMKEQKKAGGS